MHANYTPNTTLSLLDSPHGDLLRGDFWLIWWVYKPHGLPTVLWEWYSLLDMLLNVYHEHPIIQQALDIFGIEWELGMLTRLDNDTAGMVWFAHTHEGKSLWLQAQDQWQIHKIYEADVIGRMREPVTIDAPIRHHRYDMSKMIIDSKQNTHQGRWNTHQVSTLIIPWEISGNHTHIQAIIHQWCRHQIRIHCTHYGNPIIGETLYHKQKTDTTLHLWSVGIDRDQLWWYIMINWQNQDIL